MKKNLSLIAISLISIITANAQKSSGIHIIKTFHIASAGGWDYLEVGPVNNRIYVSHGTQVNILDKNTGDSVGVIENTTGVHGITFDLNNQKGFTSNGRLNTVTVFDLNTNKILAQIPAGLNPDAINYEPFSKKIITCNGRGKNLSIIDPVTNTTIDSVDVGGKPEAAVSDGKGKFFVNIEDKNEIVVVDTKTWKVLNHWSIMPGEGPTGLAFDTKTNRLFAGCEKKLMVIDAIKGTLVSQVLIGDGCDGVAFDPAKMNIYTSNGEGTLTVIHEDNADKYSVTGNIPTKRGARTIALDQQTHLIYLPTAEFEAADPNQKTRPKMIPGTFQVLVLGE